MFLLTALSTLAFAQDGVTEVTQTQIDQYTFQIENCERVRAKASNDRTDGSEPTAQVVMTIHNASDTDCNYTGLVLKGFFEGGRWDVTSSAETETGFRIGAGGTVSFKLSPPSTSGPRGDVKMEIPPERGYILFDGQAPVAEPVAEAPAPVEDEGRKGKRKKKKNG